MDDSSDSDKNESLKNDVFRDTLFVFYLAQQVSIESSRVQSGLQSARGTLHSHALEALLFFSSSHPLWQYLQWGSLSIVRNPPRRRERELPLCCTLGSPAKHYDIIPCVSYTGTEKGGSLYRTPFYAVYHSSRAFFDIKGVHFLYDSKIKIKVPAPNCPVATTPLRTLPRKCCCVQKRISRADKKKIYVLKMFDGPVYAVY